MAPLDRELAQYITAGHAPGSQKALRTALGHFERFRRLVEEDRLPSYDSAQPLLVTPSRGDDHSAALHNERTLMRFALYLANRRCAPATVQSYCSLVRSHFSLTLGVPMSSDTPRWRRLTRALQRRDPRERHTQSALRATHLRKAFCAGVGAAATVDAVNQLAATVTGWQLMTRPQELINLRRAHLTFVHGADPHAVIMLTPLKKKPGQRAVPMLVSPGDGSGVDAYHALRRLEMLDPVPPAHRATTPLFRQGDAPLTARDVTNFVRHVVAAAGDDPRTFSGRSLRIGGATELASLGVPSLTIQLLGRWDSAAYRAYTRVSQGQALRLSAALATARAHDPSLEAAFPGYRQSA